MTTKKLLLLATLIISLSACKKDFTSIGLDMEDDLLGATMDTTAVTAYSVLYDSLLTTNLSNQVIGEINDPVFGKTLGSVYSQFLLTGSDLYSLSEDFHPVLDSVVMMLQISNFYGDTTAPLNIGVYELTEDLETEAYYSNSTTQHSSVNLNKNPQQSFYVRPNTPVLVDDENLSPHLRIRLDHQFGERLLSRGLTWITNELLLEEFKGLYIEARSSHNTGCLLYCNMVSSLSGVILYYHTDLDDHLSYTFAASSEDGIFYNNFNHENYQGACQDLRRQILNHETSNAATLYLQAAGGVKTKISLPNIRKKFAAIDNRVVINRAELVITNCYPNENIFHQPANLAIQGVLKDGTLTYIPDDELISPTGFFGGTYNALTGEYRIRITQYVQNLILHDNLYADYVYLTIKGSGIRANRLVFYGSNLDFGMDNKKLRLEIAYTPY